MEHDLVDELNKITFHDQTLNSMEFDLLNQKIILKVEVFDDTQDDYKSIKISFSGVKSLHFDDFQMDKVTDIEIASFDFKTLDNGISANLLFLAGFGLAPFRIDFLFEKVVL